MSGPKHTPLVHLGVELDNEEAQDVIDTLQDLVNSQERDIERLAEALKQLLDYTLACELIVYDVEEQHIEHPVVAAARAALREAGVES